MRPGLPGAQGVHEIGGGDLCAPVTADEGRAHRVAVGVQRDQRVLLGGDPDGLDTLQQAATRGFPEGEQPGLGVDVARAAALGGIDRMGGVPLPEHGTGVCVADHDAGEIR